MIRTMMDNLKNTGLRWLWVSVLIVALDQWSKALIVNNFDLYEYVAVTPFFNIKYAINTGAAWSFLSQEGGWQLWFFTGIAVLVVCYLAYSMLQLSYKHMRLNLAYGLIIGGALGNAIDRLQHGFVVDFFHFYWRQYHYPIFNVADIAICIGAGLMVIDAFIVSKQQKQDAYKKGS
jgi:signal peptidase II